MTYKAGVILVNKNKIALVYRDYYDDYSFPKGHVEDGETLLECAVRETEEETKRKVKLISEKEIYVEKYKTSKGEKCTCYYYLGKDDGKSDNTSIETHDLVWTQYDEVLDRLSYESLKNVWKNVKNEVGKYIND